jgi:hypothetical protein
VAAVLPVRPLDRPASMKRRLTRAATIMPIPRMPSLQWSATDCVFVADAPDRSIPLTLEESVAQNRLRSPGDRDISVLYEMYKLGTLRLAPEFQREGVWPQAAKAYLIDTILSDRPIPLLFFSKVINAHSNRATYDVVDGQQRLRAVFEFLEDNFRLPRSLETDPRWQGKKYSALEDSERMALLNYDMAISELKNYSQADIRDVFLRMNKYVVRLNSAEMRRARESGAFKEFCAKLGQEAWWEEFRILTKRQKDRLRGEELAAEFAILLIEGPQDKKESVDVYYAKYADEFPDGDSIQDLLRAYLDWIRRAIPDFTTSRWRRPVDLYSLLGAISLVTESGELLDDLDPRTAGISLTTFEKQVARAAEQQRRDPDAVIDSRIARYLSAASSQTDNIKPRITRIDVVARVLERPTHR